MYATRILNHYLKTFAEHHGIKDVDVWVEIDEMCNDFEERFEKIENRLSELESTAPYKEPQA